MIIANKYYRVCCEGYLKRCQTNENELYKITHTQQSQLFFMRKTNNPKSERVDVKYSSLTNHRVYAVRNGQLKEHSTSSEYCGLK